MFFIALKGSPSRKRLTFKEPKRSVINEEPTIVNSPTQLPPPPIPPALPEPESNYKNLKDFKPIDSMDSVSGILNPSTSLINNHQPKFSNLNELNEDEYLKPSQRSQHLSSSSISIKIEHHSPVKIKTTNDLIEPNQSPQITRIRSPIESPNQPYRFNGNF